jgi:hypothetical protein
VFSFEGSLDWKHSNKNFKLCFCGCELEDDFSLLGASLHEAKSLKIIHEVNEVSGLVL